LRYQLGHVVIIGTYCEQMTGWRYKPPQGPDFRRRMNSQRTPQQLLSGYDIVERQSVDGRAEQRLTLAFHPFHRLKLGSAPATRLGTVQRGAAKRTAFHPQVSR
jgi:hypothetical protein